MNSLDSPCEQIEKCKEHFKRVSKEAEKDVEEELEHCTFAKYLECERRKLEGY